MNTTTRTPATIDLVAAAPARAIDGLINNDQCAALAYIARVAPARGINIEIGSYKGKSTRAILDGLGARGSLEQFWTADPWEAAASDHGCGLAYDEEGATAIRDAFFANTASMPLNVSMRATGEKSAELWTVLPSIRIRFAFVDGDHSYEAVRDDAVTLIFRIAPGGVIVFDDYDAEPVRDAVDEFAVPHALEEWKIGNGRMKVLQFGAAE